jgi:hypothetical protein
MPEHGQGDRIIHKVKIHVEAIDEEIAFCPVGNFMRIITGIDTY